MKLNGTLLRNRRLELGLTSRELGRSIGGNTLIVKRLEETGNPMSLLVRDLSRLLDGLSLSISEAIYRDPGEGTVELDLVETIGSMLFENRKFLHPYEIAEILSITMEETEEALAVLAARLTGVGLRLNRTASGVRIMQSADHEVAVPTESRRAKYLARLQHADLMLLHQVVSGPVHMKSYANAKQGNVRIRRLELAGLTRIVDGMVVPTDELLQILT